MSYINSLLDYENIALFHSFPDSFQNFKGGSYVSFFTFFPFSHVFFNLFLYNNLSFFYFIISFISFSLSFFLFFFFFLRYMFKVYGRLFTSYTCIIIVSFCCLLIYLITLSLYVLFYICFNTIILIMSVFNYIFPLHAYIKNKLVKTNDSS